MPRIAESIVIRAPLATVFAYHSDPATAVQWSPNVVAIQGLTGDPHATGTTWTAVGRLPPLPVALEVRFRVVECLPPYLVRLTMEGAATATVTNRYEAVDAGSTRVEIVSDYQPPRTFFARAVDTALVQRVLTGDVRRSLRGLKRAIEALR